MPDAVCINGQVTPAPDAHVSVFDAGFMQGIGLFETMRAYGGRVFRLDAHLDRLIASARRLGWTVPPDAGELRDAVQRVLLAARTDEARVRLTVTTGSLHAEAADTPRLTVVATASPGQKYPPECYTKGVTVIASDYRVSRFDPTLGHKTTSYFSRLAMLRVAHLKGAFEALVFTDDDLLTEGAISNVFVVRNEELWTPPVDTPVLPGITRAAVIEVARELGLAVRETGVTLDDVLSADEVFLTGSMMEVVPVVRIERQAVAQEKIGDVTRQIGLAYARLVDQECPV